MTDRSGNAFHDFEKAGWERAAAYYGDAFGALTAQTAQALLDAAALRAKARVLDVACGPGFITAAAAARGAKTTGLDFSPAMIAEARRRNPSLTFEDGDAERLPFGDGTFDAVVMNFGMLHLARPERAIAEAHRVLVPGGRYAFTVWAGPDQAVGFGMVLRAIEGHGRTDIRLPEGPPFFQFSNPDESRRALEAAGFVNVSVETLPLTWSLASPDAVFAALSNGGVRTSAVLRAQTPDALEHIRSAVHHEVQRYSAGGRRFDVPMPAVLSAATRL